MASRGRQRSARPNTRGTTRAEQPRWNEWTTLRRVQFDYEKQAAPRGVRLSRATPHVGDAVRVGVSGIELEGRIIAIEGSILRVELSAHVAARVERVIEDAAARSGKRRGRKKMTKASLKGTEHKRQAG
jgi:hypothetical protein